MTKYNNIKEAVLELLDRALKDVAKPGHGKTPAVKISNSKKEKPLKLSLKHANSYSDNKGLDTLDRPGILQIMFIGEKTGDMDGGLMPNVLTGITKEADFNLDEKVWDAYREFDGESEKERINPDEGNITVHSELESKGNKKTHKFSIFLNSSDVDFLHNSVRNQLNEVKSENFKITKENKERSNITELNQTSLINPMSVIE